MGEDRHFKFDTCTLTVASFSPMLGAIMKCHSVRLSVHHALVLIYKDQLSLTNPRDALHHAERAANK